MNLTKMYDRVVKSQLAKAHARRTAYINTLTFKSQNFKHHSNPHNFSNSLNTQHQWQRKTPTPVQPPTSTILAR